MVSNRFVLLITDDAKLRVSKKGSQNDRVELSVQLRVQKEEEGLDQKVEEYLFYQQISRFITRAVYRSGSKKNTMKSHEILIFRENKKADNANELDVKNVRLFSLSIICQLTVFIFSLHFSRHS